MSMQDPITQTMQENDILIALKNVIGFKEEIAKPLALNIFKEFQAKWGGQRIYISVDDQVSQQISQRNQLIKKEFTGDNHAEICRRHNISLRTLYRVIR